jgi:hypothetical protein
MSYLSVPLLGADAGVFECQLAKGSMALAEEPVAI